MSSSRRARSAVFKDRHRRSSPDYYESAEYYDDYDETKDSDESSNRFHTKVEDEKAISVTMYRNGDAYDPGQVIKVTRKRFRNWVAFLDYLTKRVDSPNAVHYVYDMNGDEIRHFRDLESDEEYAAGSGGFIELDYGGKKDQKWSTNTFGPGNTQFQPLDADESLKIYLENQNFRPTLNDMWDDPGFDRTKEDKPKKKKSKKRSKSEKRSKRR